MKTQEKIVITIYIPKELNKKAQKIAEKLDISRNYVLWKAIEQGIQNFEHSEAEEMKPCILEQRSN